MNKSTKDLTETACYVLMVIFLMSVAVILIGCSTTETYKADGSYTLDTSNNFYGKAVSAEGSVYGLKASAATAQEPTPAFQLGLVQSSLDTFPVNKGQPFKVTRRKGSIWNSNAITETVIEIGVAPDDCNINIAQSDNSVSVAVDTGR